MSAGVTGSPAEAAQRGYLLVAADGHETYFKGPRSGRPLDRRLMDAGVRYVDLYETRPSTEHCSVISEAAQVLESAAAHNRTEGRTVLAHAQQDRADRLREVLAAMGYTAKATGAQP